MLAITLALLLAAPDVPVAKHLVFVDDIAAPADASADASALTASLCTALAADPRLEVICAPDVKQLLAFSAASLSVGGASPQQLTDRLANVEFVVTGALSPQSQKGAFTLQLKAGRKAPGADPVGPYTDKPTFSASESGSGRALHAAAPALAKKIAAVLCNESQAAPPALLNPH